MSVHLLAIGNNYPGTASSLLGCVNDAHDTAAEFGKWTASSSVITNSKADHDGVFKAGRKFLDRLQPGDLGILSISGHGTREKIAGQWHEAIVLADFALVYDNEFDTLLSDRESKSFLAVFADTCYSGGLPRGGNTSRRARRVYRSAKTIPLARCQRHKLYRAARALRNVIYFSGCKADEYAYDGTFNARANGAMTYYLLKAFRERNEKTTFGQLFKRLAGNGGYLPDADYDQTPTCTASATNLRKTLKSFAKAA